ncbi:hypothetical protein CBA19CS22_12545 [Caballeronia novacaledonica]|uniref:Uncharacterized protein n=1 Tax=Caballeronia novacaledonica TaxID=1544861 RepID=A0ACB5QQL4_9BURK|nr:hypothetical protein CBA19CS11_32580 [Caballeronia novacaledonica]GJH17373.1 hypothetical protein CBA19CS22_12545 [Caballeronia novacaledonica]
MPFYPASARQAQAAEKVVSSIIDELLVVPIPPDFTAEQIIKANLWRIGDLGYCANGKVDIASVRRDLLKKFGEEFLVQVGAPVDELSKWVHRALVRGESVASVSRNAILIAFLFDSVSVLKECLFGREVGEYEHPRRGVYVKYAVTTSPDREKELTYKRLAKTYFSDNPNASRTECELEMPGMVRWLRLHCRAWYERNFPKSRLTLKRERDSTEYHRELDRSLCEHLTRRHAELTKAGLRPRRHTERLLLSGHARGNEYASLKAYLPTSRQLLERLTESQEQYKERLAIWAIRYSEPSDENQLDYAHRLTGLPYYKLAEIVSVDSRIKSASRT